MQLAQTAGVTVLVAFTGYETRQGIVRDSLDYLADAAGERARLAADWERARTVVFAQLLAGIGSFHDAEDVLQEVAVSVAKNYSSYDPSRSFVAWALGITRNHILMYFRRCNRSRLVFNEELMISIGQHLESQPEYSLDHRREALHDCIGRLEGRQRRLIELRYSRGLSIEKMAASLGKSVAAVKGSLHRVRRALERCIDVRTSRRLQ